MAGYGARSGPARGVHDDLFGRCLVLEDASWAAALVEADVLQLPKTFTDHVRLQVARRTGIPREHVLVCATHTHSGPDMEGRYTPGGQDRSLAEVWQRALAGCAEAAWRARQDAAVGIGVGSVQGIGVNRRTQDGQPVDPMVGVISARGQAGVLLGVLFNYTCHPVVLGGDNLLFSADYPGYAIRAIEAIEGPHTIAMFTNGAEGDVNTGHSADLSGIGAPIPERTFERAQRLGRRLAGEVLKVLSGTPTPLTGPVRAIVQEVTLPFRHVASVERAEAALAAAEREVRQLMAAGADPEATTSARIRRFHAEVDLMVATQRAGETESGLVAELQAIRVGDLALVAIPGELFVELGLAIKAGSPFDYTLMLGLANGSVGYLPTREACQAGGYEAVATRFAPGTGELVRDTCLEILHTLKEATP
ncbi:MAG TPA: neutral/alkaline non-lysosomal ceramidase N-terminal domain-containing protein [bacterium]|nr:neutral/alkaline non-lysosomal ceramidase N-terminal domain-containing protein [bacterium]